VQIFAAVIVVLVFAAIVTVWVLAVTRWKKWSGGCGSCQALHDSGYCCQDDADQQPSRPR
jgi:hypothetical protein